MKEKKREFGEPLTENEAALIYCIIGKNENGLPPTVDEALAYFDPKLKKKYLKENSASSYEDLSKFSEQLTLF